jgi:hypothetical protein
MKTIIKGAIYTNGDELLRAHYSGNYLTVDCTEYKPKGQIENEYNEELAEQFTGEDAICLTYKGVKYYECEYSPFHADNLILLSDISELEFYDNETEF